MTQCAMEGCEGKAKSRGWCGKHYALWRTHGDPLTNLKDKSEFRRALDWRSLDDVAKMKWGQLGSGYRGA